MAHELLYLLVPKGVTINDVLLVSSQTSQSQQPCLCYQTCQQRPLINPHKIQGAAN